MALKIRMSRAGAKKRPFYRIVVADSRMPRDGRYIERLGIFNPLLPKEHKERLKLDLERIKHWLDHGAKPSDRIARFLDEAGLWKRKPRHNPQKGKPHAKAVERLKAQEEAKQAAEAAPAETVKAEKTEAETKEAETESQDPPPAKKEEVEATTETETDSSETEAKEKVEAEAEAKTEAETAPAEKIEPETDSPETDSSETDSSETQTKPEEEKPEQNDKDKEKSDG